MDAVLVGRNGRETAVALASALKIPLYRFSGYTFHGEVMPSTKFGHILNWGCAYPPIRDDLMYNQGGGIALASAKPTARKRMAEAGISVPSYTWGVFPCIGRPNHHHAGRGFWVCFNDEDQRKAIKEGAMYFSNIYPKTREFRVHVGHGAVLFVQEKVPRDGQEDLRKEYIWNHANGNFIFRVARQNLWSLNVIQIAIQAVGSLGLDFGGVDVMADPTDESVPRYVVCEVNTAPTLSGESYGLEKYVEYFRWLLSDSDPMPHFKVESSARKDYVLSHLIGGQK